MTQVTDHGGGVRSISVPIPDNPLGTTLVHLVDTDLGPVLIDTGWDDPASWDALAAGLTACGVSVAEVHGVVITHHHPDHHGLSGKVREASGAWIAMHALDTAIVRRTRENRPDRWFSYMADKLASSGAPEEHVALLREARAARLSTGLPAFAPALPDREIVPGELLDLAGRRLRAIWTPATHPATSASTWRRPTRPLSPATAASSPATTFSLGSLRTSACTRIPTTPPSPILSATIWTPWSASAA